MRPTHTLCLTAIAVWATVVVPATPLPAQTGADRPKQSPPANRPTNQQYKRVHQAALRQILDGKLDAARRAMAAAIADQPSDPEHWFMQAILHGQTGAKKEADLAIRRAVELGLPAERFLAGPRALLEPLATTDARRAIAARFVDRPVHGPMLGDLTASSVRVWLRTGQPADVEALVTPADGVAGRDATDAKPIVARGRTSAATDYTAVLHVTGLQPRTRYRYSVRVAGGEPITGGSFRTFPQKLSSATFKIAFGGGAGYVPDHERVWDTIGKFAPDALLLLGDNVYIDAPRRREMQRYCYYRRQSRPEFRRLVASTPVYAIWDDHDFGTNDCFYGDAIDKPAFKRKVLEIFQQNWANPAYGLVNLPGCFYRFAVADVSFTMLDGRFYRNDPKGESPSMLGKFQRDWMLSHLALDRSTLRLLCSPVPWTLEAKGKSLDTWNGFQAERGEIFKFLGDSKLEGIVLLSADRHRTDIWKIPRPGHYPFVEFSSSRLTNQHVHPTMRKAEFSYNRKQSFCIMEFDIEDGAPRITTRVIDIDGEVVHTHVLRYRDLIYK